MTAVVLPLNAQLRSQESVKNFLLHMDDTDEIPAILMDGELPAELEGWTS